MKKILGLFALLLVSTSSSAVELYDAGEPIENTSRCVAEGCLGTTDWTIITQFTASEDWNITGFEFFASVDNVYNSSVTSIDNYSTTSWSIISGDDPFGAAIFSGVETASSSFSTVNNLEVITFLISDLTIALESGTYFLSQHHDFTDETALTVFETNTIDDYYHTDGNRQFSVSGEAVALKIIGTVPEPALFGLFGLALLGLVVTRRKKALN